MSRRSLGVALRGARLAGAGCAGRRGRRSPHQRSYGSSCDAAEPREAGRWPASTSPRAAAAAQIEVYGTSTQIAKLRTDGVKVERRARPARPHDPAAHAPARPPQARRLLAPRTRAYRRLSRYDRRPQPDRNSVPRAARPAAAPVPEDHRAAGHRQDASSGVPIYRHEGDASDAAAPTRRLAPGRALLVAQQHAREWLAGETGRRTLRLLRGQLRRDGHGDRHRRPARRRRPAEEITKLVDTRELWFVLRRQPGRLRLHVHARQPPVAQEPARQRRRRRASTSRRRRRPEPQLPTHWGLRRRGLVAAIPSSETYRGTGPDSEPETKALDGLMERVDFAFNKNDHTFGQLLLWPSGFQVRHPRRGRRRSSGRWPAPTTNSAIPELRPGRRRRSSTPPTATPTTTPTTRYGRSSASRPRAREPRVDRRERLRVPGRRGRRPGGVRAPPAVLARHGARRPTTRATRSRTWATRRRTSRSTRSTSPTATRRPSRSTAKRDARPRRRCTTASTTAASRPAETSEWRGGERYGAHRRRLLPPPARRGPRAPTPATR